MAIATADMVPRGQPHDRSALVLYGSETGNAQELAEEMGRLTERLRFSTQVAEFDSLNLNALLHHTVVLFTISTTGQGEVPGNARSFWRKLRNAKLQPGCLEKTRFASFGLGDSSYPQFNWAHRKFFNRLRHLGAVPLHERGESDEQHPEGVEGCFLPWAAKLRQSLLDLYPLPHGLSVLAEEDFLTPKWALVSANASPQSGHLQNGHYVNWINASTHSLSNGHSEEPTTSSTSTSARSVTAQSSMKGRQTLSATLLKNERLTPADHWQDVRLFDFVTDPVDYAAGDVMTIVPKSDEQDVNTILSLMNWQAQADGLLRFERTSIVEDDAHYPPPPVPVERSTLRELLTSHLDINAIPRRSFFAQIAHFTSDQTQKERLLEFTMSEYVDELYDYTTRPRRSIIEVLQEFDTVKIPIRWVASVFPVIRGRQFSIASGGQLKRTNHGQSGRIQLLVAIVKYKTVIKKIREGLCTKYLAALRPGAKLTAVLCKGGMRHDVSKPALMIGPGTGLAPLRSMLYERSEASKTSIAGFRSNVLIFGGRNRSADYFFADEWSSLTSAIGLHVITAFSRDQKAKIYVQDVIREHVEEVYEVLRDGNVYICGSSGKMPQAVREALIEVVARQDGHTRSSAEQFLVDIELNGRYQQETW